LAGQVGGVYAAEAAVDPLRDQGADAEGFERFLGRGKEVQLEGWAQHRGTIKSCLRLHGLWDDWEDVWEAEAGAPSILGYVHNSALLGSGQLLHAVTYGRCSSRDATNFLVTYDVGTAAAPRHNPCVAQAQLFLRLVHPLSERCVRLVIAHFYRLRPVREESDLAELVLHCPRGEFHPRERDYGVLLGKVQSPVIKHVSRWCLRGGGDEEMWAFVPFSFRSMANKVAKRADEQVQL
jgi:hypothetical protein